MEDRELIKKLIPLLLDGRRDSGGIMWRLSIKSTLEIFKLFNSNDIEKIDREMVKIAHNYPELFEIYGITIFGKSYLEYRGHMIYLRGDA